MAVISIQDDIAEIIEEAENYRRRAARGELDAREEEVEMLAGRLRDAIEILSRREEGHVAIRRQAKLILELSATLTAVLDVLGDYDEGETPEKPAEAAAGRVSASEGEQDEEPDYEERYHQLLEMLKEIKKTQKENEEKAPRIPHRPRSPQQPSSPPPWKKTVHPLTPGDSGWQREMDRWQRSGMPEKYTLSAAGESDPPKIVDEDDLPPVVGMGLHEGAPAARPDGFDSAEGQDNSFLSDISPMSYDREVQSAPAFGKPDVNDTLMQAIQVSNERLEEKALARV